MGGRVESGGEAREQPQHGAQLGGQPAEGGLEARTLAQGTDNWGQWAEGARQQEEEAYLEQVEGWKQLQRCTQAMQEADERIRRQQDELVAERMRLYRQAYAAQYQLGSAQGQQEQQQQPMWPQTPQAQGGTGENRPRQQQQQQQRTSQATGAVHLPPPPPRGPPNSAPPPPIGTYPEPQQPQRTEQVE